jgi:hypothetical protein
LQAVEMGVWSTPCIMVNGFRALLDSQSSVEDYEELLQQLDKQKSSK